MFNICRKAVDIYVSISYTVNIQYIQLGSGNIKIIIQNNSEQPIYQQIASQIENMILKGELIEGESLPSIRELAKLLKVSVITTTRAYSELERAGYVTSVQGKGFFICKIDNDKLQEQLQLTIENHFNEAIKISKVLSLKQEDLINLLKLLMEDQNE